MSAHAMSTRRTCSQTWTPRTKRQRSFNAVIVSWVLKLVRLARLHRATRLWKLNAQAMPRRGQCKSATRSPGRRAGSPCEFTFLYVNPECLLDSGRQFEVLACMLILLYPLLQLTPSSPPLELRPTQPRSHAQTRLLPSFIRAFRHLPSNSTPTP
ncbi:hypothetical protein P153DRAFT_16472 [Dothidotthia symphoricarpi CBS 119687]|uniref:Uncharacterized protein n=1 Tax=Dothidotthia symphoricarpi CBS 119687 TaxID=1392245 RepID=A0A6A6ABV7_9PLEO|nr:uncharacterized protein P153DRAFT_16472 [Dothidotthia symphoricarpi CBS 119687]KAF2129270.1 hypothetical protein P153DRAFT_16472 [Dothidotthia symphoricarpi CBS 119687]